MREMGLGKNFYWGGSCNLRIITTPSPCRSDLRKSEEVCGKYERICGRYEITYVKNTNMKKYVENIEENMEK